MKKKIASKFGPGKSATYLFSFSVQHVTDLVICLAAGLISIAWFEALKMVQRWRK